MVKEEVLPEIEQVEQHRYNALRNMGIPADDAMELCERADVVHEADYLRKKGCPPELIGRIIK